MIDLDGMNVSRVTVSDLDFVKVFAAQLVGVAAAFEVCGEAILLHVGLGHIVHVIKRRGLECEPVEVIADPDLGKEVEVFLVQGV